MTNQDYQVNVETPSAVLRKLTIKVPAATVENRYERGLSEAQRHAKVKGFRPGHVPMNVVKQMYGTDVRHQVFHHLIEEFYTAAVREKKMRTIGQPRIETPDHKTGEGAHDHGVAEGKDLTFTATVEIIPEIEPKSYTGISLSRGKVSVTEQDVELVVKSFLDSHAELVPVGGGLLKADGSPSGRAAQMGDFVEMNFVGGLVQDDGSVVEKDGMKGSRMIELGSKSLIEGFEEQVVGMEPGQTKTIQVNFPKDFYEESMAGKPAQFTVTVNEIKQKKLPELNDEFAKGLGYESVADLRTKAKEHLTRERTQEVERAMKSDLLKNLVDKNTFEVPQALIAAQARMLAQEVAQNLKQQGFNDEMVQEALKSEYPNLQTRAEGQVRASLILDGIAKKENITVEKSEVKAELKRMAEGMKIEEDRVAEYYEQNAQRMDDLEFRLREEKTVQFLYTKSKIKDEK